MANTDRCLKHVLRDLAPILVMSKIVGIFPFSIENNLKSNRKCVTFHLKGIIISMVIMAVMFVGMCSILLRYYISDHDYVVEIIRNTFNLPLNVSVGIVTIILNMTTNRNKYEEFVNRFITITDNLRKYRIPEYSSKICIHFINVTLVIINGIVLPFLCYDTVYWGKKYSFIGGLMRFSYFVNTVLTLQYCTFVLSIYSSLKQMVIITETCFKRRYYQNSEAEYRIKDYFLINRNTVSSYMYQYKAFNLSAKTTMKQRDKPAENIYLYEVFTFRRMYNEIYETALLVDFIHGIPILLEIVREIISLTANFYDIIKHLNVMGNRVTVLSYFLWSKVFWCFINLAALSCITSCCHLATFEAMKLKEQLQKQLLKYPISCDLINQLKLFTEQISANEINFTAFGVFKLNASMLSASLVTVVTYVIILVQ
ncbi:hypothetical protein L9F63_023061, partial [Diploptera punctata]